MDIEYSTFDRIRNILDMLEDDSQRLRVLDLLKEEFCFYCGSHSACQCWDQK
jgi:hypothetical protein